MAPTVTSIEVDRPPEEVFAYVTDPSRFAEWQAGVVSGQMDGDTVGAICTTTRRIGGSERASTSRLTKLDAPKKWAVQGIDGPIRATVDVDVEPVASGSRVTIAVDFEGHGIGKLLVPLVVRRQARNEMPANVQRLKERIETGG
jgi:carbon monoxide dehydrogenase subunit G